MLEGIFLAKCQTQIKKKSQKCITLRQTTTYKSRTISIGAIERCVHNKIIVTSTISRECFDHFINSLTVYDEEAAGLPRPSRRKPVNNNAEEHRRFTFLSCFRGTVIWTMLLILIMMYISIYDHLIAKPRYFFCILKSDLRDIQI